MNAVAKIVVGALVGGAVFGLLSRRASAAPALGPKANALLSKMSYQIVLSADASVDPIALLDPAAPSDPKAPDWASAERAAGKVVLVPRHLVEGTDHGAGQPTNVLGLSRADADALLSTKLYVEAP